MVKDDDVDAIVNLWLKEWCGPLEDPLSKGKNPNEPPIHQVIGEEHEGDDAQDDPLQEKMEDDDDMDDSEQHPLEGPPSRDPVQM